MSQLLLVAIGHEWQSVVINVDIWAGLIYPIKSILRLCQIRRLKGNHLYFKKDWDITSSKFQIQPLLEAWILKRWKEKSKYFLKAQRWLSVVKTVKMKRKERRLRVSWASHPCHKKENTSKQEGFVIGNIFSPKYRTGLQHNLLFSMNSSIVVF